MAEQTINIKVKVNTETGQLEVLGEQFGTVKKKVDESKLSFDKLADSAQKLLLGYLSFQGAKGVFDFFASAVKDAEDFAQAQRRVESAMKAAGIASADNRAKNDAFLQSMQELTRFSDDQAIGSLEQFIRTTGNVAQAQQAVRLAMGLSVSSGEDLSTTTTQVTDLLNGNERALISLRREYGDLLKNVTTTQQALDVLNPLYAGAAEKEHNLTSETAKLKNEYADLKKQVGEALIPSMLSLVETLKSTFDWIGKNKSIIKDFTKSVGETVFDNSGIIQGLAGLYDWVKGKRAEDVANYVVTEKGKIEAARASADAQEQLFSKVREAERLEANKAITEGRAALEKREAEERVNSSKTLATIQARAQKTAQIEANLQKTVLALDQNGYKQKIALLNAEIKTEREALVIKLQDHADAQRILAEFDITAQKRRDNLGVLDVNTKREMLKETINDALESLEIMNSMGDKGSEAEKNRAIAILALQKAVAIGWAIVAASKAAAETPGGIFAAPFIAGLLAAQIALITAQTAQGIKGINDAHKAAKAGNATLSITSELPGGSRLEETYSKASALSVSSLTDVGLPADTLTGGGCPRGAADLRPRLFPLAGGCPAGPAAALPLSKTSTSP